MLKIWKWYQNCLATHPIRTQMVSSGIIWGIGDMAAQTVTHTTSQKHNLQINEEEEEEEEEKEKWHYNWRRVATTGLFGVGFVGPAGHFWYKWLDSFIRLRLKLEPLSFRFIATKVALDVMIFGPVDLLLFFTFMGFSSGKSASQVKEDMKRGVIPAFILEGTLWPIVQVANFRFVPLRYQLLYVNFFCLLDSCFLSWLEQQEEALPWVKWFMPANQQHQQEEEEKELLFVPPSALEMQ